MVNAAGNIESFAHCPSLGGWLILGWIGFGWDDEAARCEAILNFGGRTVTAEPIVCVFERQDVRKIGTGAVIFLPDANDVHGIPHDLTLHRGSYSFHAVLASAQTVDQKSEIAHARSLISHAVRSEQWKTLIQMLEKPLFTGVDTVDRFQRPMFLQVDLAYVCPPHGLLIFGWTLDPFGIVSKMVLRCGSRAALLDPREWISVPRPDVRDGFSEKFGGLSAKCGFMAYLPDVYVPGEPPYVEVGTIHGETGFKSMAAVRSAGVDTIKDLLARLDLRYDDLVQGYDRVIGPAIEAINNFRLRNRVSYSRLTFGLQPKAPRASIIVPLYGRIDFMEYQLAFFSKTLSKDHELIYVLDDPTKLRATEILAASCFARFQYPFILLVLAENVGYAPANNVGLAVATGRYICFLNSDVFPEEPRWLDFMLETAEADPTIGVVGALLLFEDNTIQHDGCSYETLPEFGGWIFCLHPKKGLIPQDETNVAPVDVVTGACCLMSAELARLIGGFDEGYVIGDFEDADLCEKAKAQGRICVVDRRARLYHLERQSQGGQQTPWRLNLTLYNAWRFQRRWAHTLGLGETV